MKRSFHRFTALTLSLVLTMSQLALPVYAEPVEDEPTAEALLSDADEQEEKEEDITIERESEKPENDEFESADGDVEDENFEEDGTDDSVRDMDEAFMESESDNLKVVSAVSGYDKAPYEDDYESAFENYDGDELLDFEDKYISPIATGRSSRDQNPYGTCWAFATMSAVESSAALHGVKLPNGSNADKSIDLSELHLAYFAGKGVEVYDPLGGLSGDINGRSVAKGYLQGGSADTAAHVLSSWIGAADESAYPYDNTNKISNSMPGLTISRDKANDDVFHLRSFKVADPTTDRNGVKKLIKDYGTVTTAYFALGPGEYVDFKDEERVRYGDVYNETNNSYYFYKGPFTVGDIDYVISSNHAVSIIGWDDNFSRDRFVSAHKPEGDGAWLIRNSWYAGNTIDENGNLSNPDSKYYSYFWLSYYDKTLDESCYAFEMDPVDRYDHNYQYDGCMTGGYSYGGSGKYANIFKASSSSEVLKSVYFATHSANVDYKIDIYTGVTTGNPTNGVHVINSQSGATTFAGGHTIDLTTPVALEKDQLFSVVITLPPSAVMDKEGSTTESNYNTTAHTEPGRSLKLINGSWSSVTGGDYRIKAFTCDDYSTRYKVSLNGNGGTFASGNTTCSVLFRSGEKYGNLPEPSMAGYTFAGWYTSSTGGTEIKSDDTVTSNITLYAQWTQDTKTVTLNLMGGKIGNSTTNPTVQVIPGRAFPSSLPAPTKDGYEFIGWCRTTSGNTKIIPGETVVAESDSVLYARWGYKVTYDANGGSFGSGITTYSKLVEAGQTYGEHVPATREGYTLEGWYTEPVGGSKVLASSKVQSNITLYAHWKGKTIYIDFDKNGGNGTASTKGVTVGGKYGSSTDKLPTLTKTGYDFEGWFTSLEGTEKITEDTTVTKTSRHTLYAHWKPKTYTLTLNPKGGKIGTSTDSQPKSVTYGQKIGELPTPTKDGYDFAGWDLIETGGTSITSNTEFWYASDKTAYAQWTPKTYKVMFDANGGTCSTSSKNVTYKSTYGTLTPPTRTGYDFKGWFLETGLVHEVTASSTVNTASNHTLYAKWQAMSSTLYLNPNGGKFGLSTASKDITVTYDQPYEGITTPTREGYGFAGWYTEATGGEPFDTNSVCKLTANRTIYARWTANTYTLTLNPNGGKFGSSAASKDITVTYDQPYEGITTPTREGYEFAGWCTEATGEEPFDTNSVCKLTANSTIYAHWVEKSVVIHKVTFMENYAGGGSSETQVADGEAIGSQIPTPDDRNGYTFAGWFTESVGGTQITAATKVNSNVTYYAHWNPNKYTVTLNANGGTCSKGSIEVTFDANYKDLPTPTRDGYVFEGWYTEESAGTKVENSTKVTAVSDHTLYAHWTKIEEDNDDIWVSGIPASVEYTSEAITFDDMKVYRGSRILEKDVDYSVVYRNNIKVGKASVIITGKGNYNGKRTEEFYITPVNLVTAGEKAKAENVSLVDNGKIQKADTKVFYTFENGKTITLKKNADYYYGPDSYSEVMALTGEYNVTLHGKGNFAGDLTFKEKILERTDSFHSLDKATVVLGKTKLPATGKDIVFDGEEGRTLIVIAKDTDGQKPLVENVDYEVEYRGNKLPGTASVIVKAKEGGAFYGSKTQTFKIVSTPISKALIGLNGEGYDLFKNSCKYTGGPITPTVYASYTAGRGAIVEPLKSTDNVVGEEIADYAVRTYGNNVNAGRNKAYVTVMGQGRFSGTAKKKFTIEPVSLGTENEGKYFGGIEIIVGNDEDNDGNIDRKIVNGGNVPFVKYEKSGARPNVKVIFYGKNPDGSIPPEGVTLVEGKDYKVTYKNNTAVNETFDNYNKIPYVFVTGMGNFTGKNSSKQFAITPGDIAETDFEINDVVYRKKVGNFVSKAVIKDSFGKALAPNKDYDKNIELYYVSIPDGENITDKEGNAIPVTCWDETKNVNDNIGATPADPKQHIAPAGTRLIAIAYGWNAYGGTVATTTYSVVQASVASAAVKIRPMPYTGKRININTTDIISIKVGGKTLDTDDYEIDVEATNKSFANVKRGTGKVVIKGRGNYGGRKVVTFKIVNRSIARPTP